MAGYPKTLERKSRRPLYVLLILLLDAAVSHRDDDLYVALVFTMCFLYSFNVPPFP